MSDSRFKALESLFDTAMSLDPEARAAFIAEQKRADPDLGNTLANLIQHAEHETSYSEALASISADALSEADKTRIGPGSRIGHIDIVRRLGAGGMGEVFLGEQHEPLERPVAVKLVRVGLQFDQVLARFKAERQVLARMNHPCIAQVYDAGALDNGQPYVVMEYIDGEPLDDYCASREPDLDERLALFTKIADGVQHAHQRGVIHRDLKPSNVLVDKNGHPKIIDFGIARLIEDANADVRLTQMDQALGTPQYMSPEQAAFRHGEVDTRSDVFALGVLLFEMLTGSSPFDTDGRTPLEVRQLIAERDAPRLSSRVKTTQPFSARVLEGDLDWITAKALARDKERRYGSPAELVADLERYRTHEPVLAGPDEFRYRLKKFIGRHRTGVAVATVATVTIIAGLASTSIGLLRALEAERAAAESADTANATVAFIEELFESADPLNARGAEMTVREVLDEGVIRMRSNEALARATRASLLQTMGSAYSGLGLFNEAVPLLEESMALYDDTSDKPDPWFKGGQELSYVADRLGDHERATTLINEVLARQIEQLGPDDPSVVNTRLVKQGLYTGKGDGDEAREHFSLTLDLIEATNAPAKSRALLLASMAFVHQTEGRVEQAVEHGQEAVAILTDALGREHPTTLGARGNLAWYYLNAREYVAAEKEFDAIVDVTEQAFGSDHFSLGITLFNRGSLQRDLGRYADAQANYTRASQIWSKQLGDDHAFVRAAVGNAAQLLYDLGKYDESEAMYLDLIAQEREILDADDPDRAYALNNLGMVYHATGQLEKAEVFLGEAQSLRVQGLGEGHDLVLDGHINLGRVSKDRGRIEEARQRFQQAIDIATERFDARHSITARASREMGSMLIDEGQAQEALPYLAAAVEGFAAEYPDGYWETAVATSLYGEAMMLTGAIDGTESHLRSGLDMLLASEDRDSRYTREAIQRLLTYYERQDDAEKRTELQALLESL